jgi:hypothetical protein
MLQTRHRGQTGISHDGKGNCVMICIMTKHDTSATTDDSRGILSWGTLPVAAAVVVAINALYILLVAIGNITDYHTNFDFVKHVLAMDTTNFGQPEGVGLDTDVMWRAITNPTLVTIGYIGVIIWESASAIILVAATVQWIRSIKTGSFDVARRLSTVGLLMILILFMGGFITIGGEWFQMWRSTSWNGLDPAFRNSVLAGIGLILIHLNSPQWGNKSSRD